MDANITEEKLLLREEVCRIVGCAIEVLNELGHGLNEKPYENALVVEFGLRRIAYCQQQHFDVLYKMVKMGEYVPDLIAFNQVLSSYSRSFAVKKSSRCLAKSCNLPRVE